MLDISKLGFDTHYTFTDGDKVIVTNDPTVSFLSRLKKILEGEKPIETIDSIWKYLLSEEDYETYSHVHIKVKIAVIKEYFEHHFKLIKDQSFH